MRRSFLVNLALVLTLNLLVKPFYILGIDAEVQVRAGTEAYGTYAALLSLSFLFNILLDIGTTNWNTRQVARQEGDLRQQVNGILAVRGALVVLYFLVLGGAAVLLGYDRTALQLLAVLGLNQALAATLLYFRSNIAGLQRFAQDSLLSVLDRVVLIGICAWLLWGRQSEGPFPIMHFAWAQTVAYGVAVIVAGLLTARHTAGLRPRWDRPFIAGVVRSSLPYALLVLLMSFYYRTDTVMLERMVSDGALQAGIYAQGFRFFEALNMFGFLLAGLLLPMFSRQLATAQSVAPLSDLAARLVICGSVAVAIACSSYSEAIMALRYTEHVEASAPVFAILVWSFVAVCISYVYGTLLTAGGRLTLLNKAAALGMVLNIGLNLVLIPRYQAWGAAIAGCVTQWIMAIVQVVLCAKGFELRPHWRSFASMLAYTAPLMALAWLLRTNEQSLSTALLLIPTAALVLALATGLLPRTGWKPLINSIRART